MSVSGRFVPVLPETPEQLPIATPTPAVFVVGAGIVGTALSAYLRGRGVPIIGLHDRDAAAAERGGAQAGVVATSGELPGVAAEADVVLIAVQDDRLEEVARALADAGAGPRQVLLQTSGARAAASSLAPAVGRVRGVGTLHPLASFADLRSALSRLERGCTFALQGDEAARAAASVLVSAMGAPSVELEGSGMALYHAGAVFASNYLVVLVDIARGLLVRAGVPADRALAALVPLIESTVENLAAVGLPRALTGPVARGDSKPVRRHLEELAGRAPDVLDLYRRLGREALRIAREKGLGAEQLRAIEALLAD